MDPGPRRAESRLGNTHGGRPLHRGGIKRPKTVPGRAGPRCGHQGEEGARTGCRVRKLRPGRPLRPAQGPAEATASLTWLQKTSGCWLGAGTALVAAADSRRLRRGPRRAVVSAARSMLSGAEPRPEDRPHPASAALQADSSPPTPAAPKGRWRQGGGADEPSPQRGRDLPPQGESEMEPCSAPERPESAEPVLKAVPSPTPAGGSRPAPRALCVGRLAPKAPICADVAVKRGFHECGYSVDNLGLGTGGAETLARKGCGRLVTRVSFNQMNAAVG